LGNWGVGILEDWKNTRLEEQRIRGLGEEVMIEFINGQEGKEKEK
jgi:hypothetical protein